MQAEVLFELDGNAVHHGDRLHVAPGYHERAGADVEAYCESSGGFAIFRAVPSGAVPTLPISAVSWAPHPDTVDLKAMRLQGIQRLNVNDLNVWRLGRSFALKSTAQLISA